MLLLLLLHSDTEALLHCAPATSTNVDDTLPIGVHSTATIKGNTEPHLWRQHL